MATNSGKTFIGNLALSKTKAGLTDEGVMYSSGIDDTEFADFTTASNETIKRICLYYETCLKRCLEEIQPDFAKRFADLGNQITINKEYQDWGYLFELPTDFLHLIKQTDESNKNAKYDCDILDFTSYAHTVTGSDDNVYICTTAHTSVDDSSDGEPPDDDGEGNWTLDSDEEYKGADWEVRSYSASASGRLFVTNTMSNTDGDSAYIEYIPYTLGGINDDATKYPENFKHALATLLASEIELDYERRAKLLMEYETLAKPKAKSVGESDEYEKDVTKVIDARRNLTVG
jgi:hypothetical protein